MRADIYRGKWKQQKLQAFASKGTPRTRNVILWGSGTEGIFRKIMVIGMVITIPSSIVERSKRLDVLGIIH